MGLDACRVWDTSAAFQHLATRGEVLTKRTAERRILDRLRLPPPVTPDDLVDEHGRKANRLLLDWVLEKARRKRCLVLFAQLHRLPSGIDCLLANDPRKGRYWVPLIDGRPDQIAIHRALSDLRGHIGKNVVLLPCGELVGMLRDTASVSGLDVALAPYRPPFPERTLAPAARIDADPYLQRLEAESIYIIREAAATAKNPVLLHAMGKDSAVLLHLVRKAFYPGRSPLSLMHVDTGWGFDETRAFRDLMARESGMPLTVYVDPETAGQGINPFDHGAALYTRLAGEEALERAIERCGCDVVFAGKRLCEERSSTGNFSTGAPDGQGNHARLAPGGPGFWRIPQASRNPGRGLRAFPLSGWTELDIWRYIRQESIPVVSLYFARKRPVVIRGGMTLLVDDDRFRLFPGEEIVEKQVRFRSLGCYPLTGAIESAADNVDAIVAELLHGTPHLGRVRKNETAKEG